MQHFLLLCVQEYGVRRQYIGNFTRETDMFDIVESALHWGSAPWLYGDQGYPIQVCSLPCGPGQIYVAGEMRCCWTCHQCRVEEIVIMNHTSCEGCPVLHWPKDKHQLECVEIIKTYLNWSDIYGLILAGLAGGGLLLTIGLAALVTSKKNLRVIKGAGIQMLHIILFGMCLSFGAVFAHIAKPTDEVCIISRIGFHVSFTFIFGPMLVKTNRIFQVFLAASKLSRRVFMGSERSQQIALVTVFFVQVRNTE